MLVLVIPIILQHVYAFQLFQTSFVTITLYGWYVIIYLSIQFVLAVLNNISTTKRASKQNTSIEQGAPKFNVVVVGYRENPVYFKNCLKSIANLSFNKLFIVIDGCTEEDQYMVDIVKDEFHERCTHVVLEQSSPLAHSTTDYKVVCVSQAHSGKRNVMYTGFLLCALDSPQVEYVMCTDSDTMLYPDSAELMVNLMSTSTNIGGVAGNLGIFDKYVSFMTFSSSIRYWFAFNLERAYQSFNDYVLCISGPIGMYRLDVLQQVMDAWKNQTFLGQSCTYGDDRHLTNHILGLGYKVLYLPSACALTETPCHIYKFYKQQTRWSKSAYREMLWTVSSVHKHSPFMTIDITYTLLYPFFVMGYLLYVLYAGTAFELALYLSIIYLFGVVKSVYGAILGNVENIFYFSYGIVYLCVVFPAKLWALFNLKDISWGTATRKEGLESYQLDVVFLVLWNIVLLTGLGLNVTRGHGHLVYLLTIMGIWVGSFIIVYSYARIQQYRVSKNK
jgi:hyaluronan synthase